MIEKTIWPRVGTQLKGLSNVRQVIFLVLLILNLLSSSLSAQLSQSKLEDLATAGVPDEIIIALIEKDCVDFEVDAEKVLELSSKISKDVLKAAIECGPRAGEKESIEVAGKQEDTPVGGYFVGCVCYAERQVSSVPAQIRTSLEELSSYWLFVNVHEDRLAFESIVRGEISHVFSARKTMRRTGDVIGTIHMDEIGGYSTYSNSNMLAINAKTVFRDYMTDLPCRTLLLGGYFLDENGLRRSQAATEQIMKLLPDRWR